MHARETDHEERGKNFVLFCLSIAASDTRRRVTVKRGKGLASDWIACIKLSTAIVAAVAAVAAAAVKERVRSRRQTLSPGFLSLMALFRLFRQAHRSRNNIS